jgi:hypothetical protein
MAPSDTGPRIVIEVQFVSPETHQVVSTKRVVVGGPGEEAPATA